MTNENEGAPEIEIAIPMGDADEGAVEEVSNEEAEDEFAIEIEGELAEEEPPLVKQLRDEIRNRDRELANYRKQPAKIEVGEKPTIEDCDFIPEKYEQEYAAWMARKAAAENQERDAAEAERVRNETQQQKFVQYRAQATALPVQDFPQAEQTVTAALPDLLQSALLIYTKDTAKVVYALSKHPAKLDQLAKETDPIKFVLAVSELERNLKVVNRKKPPAPEADTIQRGSASAFGGRDKELERLEKEAERTGDSSKLVAYRRQRKLAA